MADSPTGSRHELRCQYRRSPRTLVPVSVPVEDRVHAERGEFAAVLSMRHAGPSPVRLRYEWVGPANAPVVVLAGGISAHRHVASNAQFSEKGWAEDLVGSGRTLDPQQLRVLAFDFIGADGALDVPIDTADQADALALLLDHLGIRTLKAFVGYSYGALVGQQFAIRHRARVRQLVLASGAHRPHPYAAAWRALQRRAVALGQLQCGEDHGPTATTPSSKNRSHRRDPRHRLPHLWRVRMSLHANEPSCSRTTAAVRAGIDRDTAHGAVTPPIVLSSNFSFEGFGNKRQYDYTRSGNPTRDLLGEALAELEGGAGGVITATGMGAINLVLNALLQPGDTLVVPHDAYGGSWRLFNALAKKGHSNWSPPT